LPTTKEQTIAVCSFPFLFGKSGRGSSGGM